MARLTDRVEQTSATDDDLIHVVQSGLSYKMKRKNLIPVVIVVPIGDETTPITTGTAKVTFRMPFAMELEEVRASHTTAGGTSGVTTYDINEEGTSVLSTKLTVDQGEKTSETAATAAVISDSSLADDAEMTIDVDGISGSGAEAGGKIALIGKRG